MLPQHSPPPNEPPDVEQRHQVKRQRTMDSPSSSERRRPSVHSMTSLPPIHHLHPDLPPPSSYQHQPSVRPPRQDRGLQQQAVQHEPPSQYSPATPSGAAHAVSEEAHFLERANAAAPQTGQSAASSSSIPEKSLSTAGDSDHDDMMVDQPGPPKKKRRRQALSCTECKRRKIKCDRAHPCGPCQRRGEEDRCQWHVVEPVEKYVTRSEWDELRGRCRALEDRCARMESLLSDVHAHVVSGQTTSSVTSTAEAHPSGLPSSPLLSRSLTRAVSHTSTNHVGHPSAGVSNLSSNTGHRRSPSQQSLVSPSVQSTSDGDPRSPTRRFAMGPVTNMSTSPSRGTRYVTASQDDHLPPTPRANHSSNLHHHYEHQQSHQPAHHRQTSSSMNSSPGSRPLEAYREPSHRQTAGRTMVGGSPRIDSSLARPPSSASDRRTSLPSLPPLPVSASAPSSAMGRANASLPGVDVVQRGAASPLSARPADADALHMLSSSYRQAPSSRPPPHVLPPLSPSIRTRSVSLSQGYLAHAPLSSSTSLVARRSQTPTGATVRPLPSPPKASRSLREADLQSPTIGTFGLEASPTLPPPSSYRFPSYPPGFVKTEGSPVLPSANREHGQESVRGARSDLGQSQSRQPSSDQSFAHLGGFEAPLHPEHDRRTQESHRRHPQLSSRSLQRFPPSKNFMAQTLKAVVVEDRLRLGIDLNLKYDDIDGIVDASTRVRSSTTFDLPRTPPPTPQVKSAGSARFENELANIASLTDSSDALVGHQSPNHR